MQPYDIVKAFEESVAHYCGAKYGVAVDSCTNALLLCCKYLNVKKVVLPARTYVGVPYAVINAGGSVEFRDYEWKGWYKLYPYPIYDSARRFYRSMVTDARNLLAIDYGEKHYRTLSIGNKDYTIFVCISFHWKKFLPIGRGGMILTDDKKAVEVLKKMRFDGRTEGVAPKEDRFTMPGYHCYMLPEEAARGLLFMSNVKDKYEDLPEPDYPDLRNNFKYEG